MLTHGGFALLGSSTTLHVHIELYKSMHVWHLGIYMERKKTNIVDTEGSVEIALYTRYGATR